MRRMDPTKESDRTKIRLTNGDEWRSPEAWNELEDRMYRARKNGEAHFKLEVIEGILGGGSYAVKEMSLRIESVEYIKEA
jgi:hypothetical protein